jgi:hypothetical protein
LLYHNVTIKDGSLVVVPLEQLGFHVAGPIE